jgi:hypothetical protein
MPAKKKEETRVYTTKTFLMNNKEVTTDHKDELVEVQVFATEPAVISLEYGLTLNMGNFESCRLSVGIRLPCYKEQVDSAYEAATAWVEERVQAQVRDIRTSTG